MVKRLLISSYDGVLVQTALVQGRFLLDYNVDKIISSNKQFNIYKGYVTKVEIGLNAVFVDYGEQKQGFLPFREISSFYFKKNVKLFSNFNMKVFIEKNDEFLVQIVKEERVGKGALLTTYLRIIGNYLILFPNTIGSSGVSKKMKCDDRKNIKNILESFSLPFGMSVIARTVSYNKQLYELEWDLNLLLTKWNSIKFVSTLCKKPFLIYSYDYFYSHLFSDILSYDVSEIIIDNFSLYKDFLNFFESTNQLFLNYIKLYNEVSPLFFKFKIEKQIEAIFKRIIDLPSGGSITIDQTEALISIDVNSAKVVNMDSIEETALSTNLEAIIEITRQLKIRDLAGIIVIDFIDMCRVKNKILVEKNLLKELKGDKAKIKVGKISQFGVVELSRQRLGKSITDYSESVCLFCEGRGVFFSIDFFSFILLQRIQIEIAKTNVNCLNVELPLSYLNFFINKKKNELLNFEKKYSVKLNFLGDFDLVFPQYKLSNYKIRGKFLNLKNICFDPFLLAGISVQTVSKNFLIFIKYVATFVESIFYYIFFVGIVYSKFVKKIKLFFQR